MQEQQASYPTVVVASLAEISPEPSHDARKRIEQFREYAEVNLTEGDDYGVIPGTKAKSLWQAGAEKLMAGWRVRPEYEIMPSTIVDHHAPLFHYDIRCKLFFGANALVGEGVGSCNSKEKKYAWRWVTGEDLRNIPEIKHLVGANLESRTPKWQGAQVQFRVPNWEVADLINTIMQMASKRAMVKAVRSTFGLSGNWTQGLNDPEDQPREYSRGPMHKGKVFEAPHKEPKPKQIPDKTEARTCVDVWDKAKVFFQGKGCSEKGVSYAANLICGKYDVGQISEIPDDQAEALRDYIHKSVTKELREENYLPMEK